MKKNDNNRKSKGHIFSKLMFLLCVAILAFAIAQIFFEFEVRTKDNNLYSELSEEMEAIVSVEEDLTEEAVAAVQLSMEEMFARNGDMVAWISIPNTPISYPVMHTPNDPEYYLRRDFYGDTSISGTPFASGSSTFDPSGDNTVIYGHHMDNGTMFSALLNYVNYEYWAEHSLVQLRSLSETKEYEVVFAFYENIEEDGSYFQFHQFIYANSQEEFDEFVANCTERSLHLTGEEMVFGDEFLTLVTCTNVSDEGRFVVVARRIA